MKLFLLVAFVALCRAVPQNAVAVEVAAEGAAGVAEMRGAGESHSDVQNDYSYKNYGLAYAGSRLYMAPWYSQTNFNKMMLELEQCKKEKAALINAAEEDIDELLAEAKEPEEDKEEIEEVITGVAPTCAQSYEVGPCRSYTQRYYFNSKTQRCEIFYYGGCLGNTNNFVTLESCERSCVISSKMLTAARFTAATCQQPKDAGPCTTWRMRYHYNSVSGKCEAFYFGGCGGNSNNFMTDDQCQKQCDGVCQMPVASGPCLGKIQRWYHNAATDRCERFTYSGCGGNANNFVSWRECMNSC